MPDVNKSNVGRIDKSSMCCVRVAQIDVVICDHSADFSNVN